MTLSINYLTLSTISVVPSDGGAAQGDDAPAPDPAQQLGLGVGRSAAVAADTVVALAAEHEPLVGLRAAQRAADQREHLMGQRPGRIARPAKHRGLRREGAVCDRALDHPRR